MVSHKIENHKCCANRKGWVVEGEIVPYDDSMNNPNHREGTDECEALKERDWGYPVLFFFGLNHKSYGPFFTQGLSFHQTTSYSTPSFFCRDGGLWVEQTVSRIRVYPREGRTSNSEPKEISQLLGGSHPDELGGTSAERIAFWSAGGCRLFDGLMHKLNADSRSVSIRYIETSSKMVSYMLSGQMVFRLGFSSIPDSSFESAQTLDEFYKDESGHVERFVGFRPLEGYTHNGISYQSTITKKANICAHDDGGSPPDPEVPDDDNLQCFPTGLKNRQYRVLIDPLGFAVANDERGYRIFNPATSRMVKRKDFFCGCGDCEIKCQDCCIDLTEVATRVNNSLERFIS